MEAKIKHLEFIQAAMARMAGNSFLLKGWAVTLTGGLLALAFKQIDLHYLALSIAVLFLFWSLDSYYLSAERRFRALYEKVRLGAGDETDFSMETSPFRKKCKWVNSAFSRTMLLFYGGLLAVHFLIIHFI
jgi:hypothetical protein